MNLLYRLARRFVDWRIRRDPELAWSHHCVIACACMDEGAGHEAANRAAARAMTLLHEADTAQLPMFKDFEFDWSSQFEARSTHRWPEEQPTSDGVTGD